MISRIACDNHSFFDESKQNDTIMLSKTKVNVNEPGGVENECG